jgi:Flp pilus assembly protein TadG
VTILKRSRGRRERGQGLVEMALVLPVFLLLIVSFFDLGQAVFAYNTLTNAAREGARFAIVNQDETAIKDWAKSQTRIVELNDPSVSVTFWVPGPDGAPGTEQCATVAVGCVAVVSFEATYVPITPIVRDIVFPTGVTFTAQAVLAVEYACPNATFSAAQCPKA